MKIKENNRKSKKLKENTGPRPLLPQVFLVQPKPSPSPSPLWVQAWAWNPRVTILFFFVFWGPRQKNWPLVLGFNLVTLVPHYADSMIIVETVFISIVFVSLEVCKRAACRDHGSHNTRWRSRKPWLPFGVQGPDIRFPGGMQIV